MKRKLIIPWAVALTFSAWPAAAMGQEDQHPKSQNEERLQSMEQEPVYGWQLMDQQERQVYRDRMRELRTEEEREAFRSEHHELMQERARQMGVTLPDELGPHRKGMGPEGGMRGSGTGGGRR